MREAGSGPVDVPLRTACLWTLLVSELWNPRREPHATPVANEEHRAGAVRRRRIQRIVDSKIAVRFERNTRHVGVAFDKRRRGLTNQRSKDALVRVLPDGIAAGQEQAAPSDSDTAVEVNFGSEVGDPPRTGAGEDSSHDVQLYVRERSIRVHGSGTVRHRDNTDTAFEPGQKVALVRADLTNNPQGQ
jgi:hypothetical protein